MTYDKQTWTDGSTGGTPLSADRLNHIETGVDEVDAALVALIAALKTVAMSGSYSDLTGKPTIPTSVAGFTDATEFIQDTIGAMLVSGGAVTIGYDDDAGKVTVTAPIDPGTDTEVVRDAIGAALIGVQGLTVGVNDAADTITLGISGFTISQVTGLQAALDDRLRIAGDQMLTDTQKNNLRTLIGAASATAGSLPTLAHAPAGFEQPASSRSQITSSNDQNAAITSRLFFPSVDANARTFRPEFTAMWTTKDASTAGDSPWFFTPSIKASAIQPDGTKVPLTQNGSTTLTVPQDGSPLQVDLVTVSGLITATSQADSAVTASGVFYDCYMTLPGAESHTAGATTSGSSVITDPAVTATHYGRKVTGTGIPSNSRIGAVTAGTSFVLMNERMSATVNATATNATATLTLEAGKSPGLHSPAWVGDGWSIGDLTAPGSAVPQARNGPVYLFGPSLILGPASKTRIVGSITDSIFNGFQENSGTGAVSRACRQLGFGHVKLSRTGEYGAAFANLANRRLREPYIKGCTDIVIEMLANDGAPDLAVAQNTLTALVNIARANGAKRVLVATVPPKTSSTDNWATTANQTPGGAATPAMLTAINDWIRTKPVGIDVVIDLADLTMSARNSGVWAVDGNPKTFTIDGVHPSAALSEGPITSGLRTALASVAA